MDVMLDLETLATTPDCVILTFGAVKFDPFDGTKPMDQGIYFRVNVDQQIELGRRVDDDTVAWWGRQNDAVREEALGEHDRVELEEFARQLNKFIANATRVWAQGPTFDIVILENLYRQLGKPTPWQFYKIRDSRTLLKALGDDREPGELLHNALADCVSQAQAIQSAVKRYKLTEL